MGCTPLQSLPKGGERGRDNDDNSDDDDNFSKMDMILNCDTELGMKTCDSCNKSLSKKEPADFNMNENAVLEKMSDAQLLKNFPKCYGI
jgi:hypothetical protein